MTEKERLSRELKLYREGYELRGKLLTAYRTGGRPSDRVLDGLSRVARELEQLDRETPLSLETLAGENNEPQTFGR